MMTDAEKHATEDAKKKELVEARNLGEALVYTSEKMVKENDAKIKDEDKKELNEKAEAVKTSLKSESVEEIKKATEELSKVAQRIGGELYKQSTPPADTPPNPENEIPQEDPKN